MEIFLFRHGQKEESSGELTELGREEALTIAARSLGLTFKSAIAHEVPASQETTRLVSGLDEVEILEDLVSYKLPNSQKYRDDIALANSAGKTLGFHVFKSGEYEDTEAFTYKRMVANMGALICRQLVTGGDTAVCAREHYMGTFMYRLLELADTREASEYLHDYSMLSEYRDLRDYSMRLSINADEGQIQVKATDSLGYRTNRESLLDDIVRFSV